MRVETVADNAIMADEGITLQTVLDHMQAHRNDLSVQMSSLKLELNKRIDNLDEKLSNRIDNVSFQIDAIDKRLDRIEIDTVEQKHEPRIRRLEEHTGLVQTA